METTRKSVLLSTTHTEHGCLQSGGVSGRVDRYDIAEVLAVLGITRAELDTMPETQIMPQYEQATARDVIMHAVRPVCVRRGHRIS
jgi:hypothetical protein